LVSSREIVDRKRIAESASGYIHAMASATGDSHDDQQPRLSDLAEEPAKVVRIGTMARRLLEEIQAAESSEEARRRLQQAQQGTIAELKQALAPQLSGELERIWRPFASGSALSETELRLGQAELVGWLEGVFHGIQAALTAEQMGPQSQLRQPRHELGGPGQRHPGEQHEQSGQYL
jgi:hypothetical protein